MKFARWLLFSVLLALLAGCGGGGGGGGSTGSGEGVALFFTDNPGSEYDHVWVEITQVQLSNGGNNAKTVFSNPDGTQIDLRTLRDDAGRRFKFITRDDGLNGTYDQVTVVMKENLVVFPVGASTGTNATFEGASGGVKTVTVTFAPRTFGPGNDDLIVDFDLDNWDITGAVVTISANGIVVLFDDNGLGDLNRHEDDDYKGTISGLGGTAPNQTFTLTQGGRSFSVATDENTSIYRHHGGTATLANGQRVEVRGVFDTATNTLKAQAIKIKSNNGNDDNDEDEVRGAPSNLNEEAGTFTVTASKVKGFLPSQETVNVVTTATTIFRADSGRTLSKNEFFALLATSNRVEVEGTYNAGTNTLTAVKAKIEDDDDDDHHSAEVEGIASNSNAEARTFSVTASEWEGMNISNGAVVNVQMTNGASYRNSNGDSMTAEAFFTALAAGGRKVEAEGTWDGTTLTASKAKLKSSGGGGGGGGGEDPHEVEGNTSAANEGAGTFSVTVFDVEGTSIPLGTTITVQTSGSTSFRNDDGDTITKAQFFAGIASGGLVEVEGVWNGTVFTAVKAKLDDD